MTAWSKKKKRKKREENKQRNLKIKNWSVYVKLCFYFEGGGGWGVGGRAGYWFVNDSHLLCEDYQRQQV